MSISLPFLETFPRCLPLELGLFFTFLFIAGLEGSQRSSVFLQVASNSNGVFPENIAPDISFILCLSGILFLRAIKINQ